jgi:hypothetical protein
MARQQHRAGCFSGRKTENENLFALSQLAWAPCPPYGRGVDSSRTPWIDPLFGPCSLCHWGYRQRRSNMSEALKYFKVGARLLCLNQSGM